jgi:hypothetical protein
MEINVSKNPERENIVDLINEQVTDLPVGES